MAMSLAAAVSFARMVHRVLPSDDAMDCAAARALHRATTRRLLAVANTRRADHDPGDEDAS